MMLIVVIPVYCTCTPQREYVPLVYQASERYLYPLNNVSQRMKKLLPESVPRHTSHSLMEKLAVFSINPRLCVLKWKKSLFFPFRDTRWPQLTHHNLQSIALLRVFFVNADKLPRALNSPDASKATPLTLRTLWWAIIRALLRCHH